MCAVITVVALVYLASNHFPLRSATPLPPNLVDRVMGMHASAIWPYWLSLVIAPTFILATTDRRILRACAMAMTAIALAWPAWPTRLARSPTADRRWRDRRPLHRLDSDINCFPSMRITAPIIAVAGFYARHPRARCWAWPFAIALMPSDIATGQHYSRDIPAPP